MDVDVAFLQVNKLVTSIVFQRERYAIKCGFDVTADSLYSIAYIEFCRFYPKWDSSLSSLHTFTQRKIKYRLDDYIRRSLFLSGREPSSDNDTLEFIESRGADDRHVYFMTDLWDELGEDARTVVSLVMDCPVELQKCIKRKPSYTFQGYFAGMDWSRRRYSLAVEQIKDALH